MTLNSSGLWAKEVGCPFQTKTLIKMRTEKAQHLCQGVVEEFIRPEWLWIRFFATRSLEKSFCIPPLLPQTLAMLNHQLIHPRINEILGRGGHHSQILIADGNYPASAKKGPNAEVVCLNLSPGCVTVKQVLRAILSAVPIHLVNTMGIPVDDDYSQATEPPVWNEFRQVLKEANMNVELVPISKWDFYKQVQSPDHILTVQTGDQALWANILLTMGCRIS